MTCPMRPSWFTVEPGFLCRQLAPRFCWLFSLISSGTRCQEWVTRVLSSGPRRLYPQLLVCLHNSHCKEGNVKAGILSQVTQLVTGSGADWTPRWGTCAQRRALGWAAGAVWGMAPGRAPTLSPTCSFFICQPSRLSVRELAAGACRSGLEGQSSAPCLPALWLPCSVHLSHPISPAM